MSKTHRFIWKALFSYCMLLRFIIRDHLLLLRWRMRWTFSTHQHLLLLFNFLLSWIDVLINLIVESLILFRQMIIFAEKLSLSLAHLSIHPSILMLLIPNSIHAFNWYTNIIERNRIFFSRQQRQKSCLREQQQQTKTQNRRSV